MKINRRGRPNRVADFNDIQVGDVLTFPDNSGWVGYIFMVIWHTDNFGKKPHKIQTIHMARLDDGNLKPNRDTGAGQTYTLPRKLFDDGSNVRDEPKAYLPARHTASLTLED